MAVADQETYRSTRVLRDTPRWGLAARDAELAFPKATEHFTCSAACPHSRGLF